MTTLTTLSRYPVLPYIILFVLKKWPIKRIFLFRWAFVLWDFHLFKVYGWFFAILYLENIISVGNILCWFLWLWNLGLNFLGGHLFWLNLLFYRFICLLWFCNSVLLCLFFLAFGIFVFVCLFLDIFIVFDNNTAFELPNNIL